MNEIHTYVHAYARWSTAGLPLTARARARGGVQSHLLVDMWTPGPVHVRAYAELCGGEAASGAYDVVPRRQMTPRAPS